MLLKTPPPPTPSNLGKKPKGGGGGDDNKEHWLASLAIFMKRIDWLLLNGILFVLLLVALGAALTIRHITKQKMYVRAPNARFESAYLPVAFLEKSCQKTKDMWLDPNQWMIFVSLFDRGNDLRHGMCTDTISWNHFNLLAAAEAYRRLGGCGVFVAGVKDVRKKKHGGGGGDGGANTQKHDDDNLTIGDLVAKSMQDISEPYLRYTFYKKDIPQEEIDTCLHNCRKIENVRGVTGKPRVNLLSRVVNILEG